MTAYQKQKEYYKRKPEQYEAHKERTRKNQAIQRARAKANAQRVTELEAMLLDQTQVEVTK